MAARKKRSTGKSSPSHRRPLPWESSAVLAELTEAESLIAHRRWQEAREALDPLVRRFPGRVEVLAPMLEVTEALHDAPRRQVVSEMLRNVLPNDPEVLLSLASAYLANARPALAVQTFHQFLERWPEHERAADVRKAMTDLESDLRGYLTPWGIAPDDIPAMAVLHEEVQSHLEQGDYPGARRVARKFLARYPQCAPVLNNVSQSFYVQGQMDEAIKTTRQVLEFDPGNIHALSNLTRYACLIGHLEEAQAYAAQLKASTEPATDRSYKIAEALSYLGDDAGTLEAFERAQAADELKGATSEALFYHLAAVAALRLDREAEARRHWKRALQVTPGLELAQENVADLNLPPEERHGPWPFALPNWMAGEALRTLATQIEAVMQRDPEAPLEAAVRAWARRHPRIVALIPRLLERGDPDGRQLALQIATTLETPEMQTALRDFALGKWGPDAMRLKAMQIAQEAGLLPPGEVRLWSKGNWNEVRLMNYEFHDEPLFHHPTPIQEQLQEAISIMQEGRLDEAERLLNQVRKIEPNAPDVLNNLAGVYSLQRRDKEAEILIRQSHALDPDYLFGRTNLAIILVHRGEIEEAKALIEPLLSRRRLHFSELASLALAQIELFIAEDMPDAAKIWLEMWEGVDPEHPLFAVAQQRVKNAQGNPLEVVRRAWRRKKTG